MTLRAERSAQGCEADALERALRRQARRSQALLVLSALLS